MMQDPPFELAEVRSAASRLRGIVRRTPLVRFDAAQRTSNLYLKLETLQMIGSFKIRGVMNAASRFSPEERAAGLSTVSAGNTAQAVARAAQLFGVSARSVMPDSAPKKKIDAVRALGGEPVLMPIADLFAYMKDHGWEEEPFAFIHPWTNRDVMIGHGSMAIELIEQCPSVKAVYIPVGGGGLLAGVGGTLKLLKPDVRVVAVEPTSCAALHRSIQLGRAASVEGSTFCDGVAVPYMTEEMFPILRAIIDDVVLVDDEDVKAMIRRLVRANRIVAEGAGALAAAAAAACASTNETAVAIVTGGSIDAELLATILSSR